LEEIVMEKVDAESIAHAWLSEMQACVRSLDYERCRAIFAEDVVAFGTWATLVTGLDALENDQWRHIWGTIRRFTFTVNQLYARGYADHVVWLACPWTSEWGAPDGSWMKRPGRITAVIERRGDKWLAVHTHHSLAPRS
jgi:ketosteroid isomerase-like protein